MARGPYEQLKGKKVLVLNKRGKTKWLRGTIVQQKSPVTNLVKVGPQMRFCHADHLLHSAMTNIDSEQDIDDVATRVNTISD